jgi:hypothetical protein
MPTETPVTLHEVLGGSERDLKTVADNTELFGYISITSRIESEPRNRRTLIRPRPEHCGWRVGTGSHPSVQDDPARRGGLVLALASTEYRPLSVGCIALRGVSLRRSLDHMRADARSAAGALLGMAVETEEPLLAIPGIRLVRCR